MVPYSNKTFLPVGPPSDDEKKSPVPLMKDKVAIYASKVSQSTSSSSVVPTPNKTNNMKNMYHGQKMLTPVVPGRLTPTGNGRIKVPVCNAQVLKREASSIDELNSEGVCFTSSEAESCADKALNYNNIVMDGKVSNSDGVNANNTNMDEMPLNIEKWHEAAASVSAAVEGNKHVSSSSTVITTSSAGSICGRSSMGNEIAAVASAAVKTDPPLRVVRTSPNPPEDYDDAHRLSSGSVPEKEQDQEVAASSSAATKNQPPAFSKGVPSSSSSASLSISFTDNLVKGNSSRQGRSLQRWLVHSPTEELVRQVAGCIPITRDGRIVLVSASRKSEWIIPKGGWDTDETKEECATRETFEEAGLLGSLGGCLEPIDYETRKAKKRRMSMSGSGAGKSGKGKVVDGRKTLSLKREADAAALRPPFSKRAKMETSVKKTTKTSEVAGGNVNNMASSAAMQPPSSPGAPASAASSSLDPASYSYVRLFLFPLYVSSVKAKWPEGGRLRKLVTIDEAIKIMEAEKRPYFCRGLEMIKERGLHRMNDQDLNRLC